MIWRRLSQRSGYLRVHVRHAGAFDLPATAYESLTHALDAGLPSWEGRDVYGDPVWFRCGDVVSVGLTSVESLAKYDAEEEDRIAHERIHGEAE